jgi:acetyl-CoA carboxylase biotin carboxyl carrier protein
MADEKKPNKDLSKVKEIIELMIEKDLVEVELVEGENKIHLRRPEMNAQPAYVPPPVAAPHQQPQATANETAKTENDDGSVEIKSPIVGTFYSSPSPDAEPYVKVGDRVEPDTVVCIVEAMKVMNELKAECSGTITKILCQTGQAVEYDQPLFKVNPD